MALKVTSSPTYTGTLKVTSTPKPPALKVTTKPVSYVTPKTYNPQQTYNPQKTAPRSTIQSTATPKQINNAQVSNDWAIKEAQRLRAEQDAIEAQRKLQLKMLADAKNKERLITNPIHLVLKTTHPSPLSCHRGFLGCKHFSKANEFLIKNNIRPINWNT